MGFEFNCEFKKDWKLEEGCFIGLSFVKQDFKDSLFFLDYNVVK